jgi:hypothetical protein
MRILRRVTLLVIGVACLFIDRTSGFTVQRPNVRIPFALTVEKKQTRGTVTVTTVEDEEAPAGIEGSQFFGGNKEKEEFYDPDAEMEAAVEVNEFGKYDRFVDRTAFPDATTAAIAKDVQLNINRVLFSDDQLVGNTEYSYANNLQWETGLQVKSNHPLNELETALGFYRRVDVAVISGERKSDTVFELRFEISVMWPALWEPRVLLTGTSLLTVVNKIITKQVDRLDTDLLPTIQKQILPRLWDLYHIGMTPTAELSPKLNERAGGLFSGYTVAERPPRLVLQPTLLDLGSREDFNAGILPNHAFSCVIKTMGPTKQRFTPVTGVQVQLIPGNAGLKLQWSIPIAVEYASNPVLVLPGSDHELDNRAAPACSYMLQPRRKVATVPYGGGPQDAAISDMRKKLYEQVVKDGLKPVLDSSGRPIFFFTMNSVKACYTEEGLGMAVYEWRPQFTQPNDVGIELELK